MARQKLGQHFLADRGWREKILETLSVAGSDVWIEIGAGHGEMTELLAESGARVYTIETDPKLAEKLREKAPSWGKVEVVEADVLTVDFEKLTSGRFRVYGNLPYYITSPILRRLFDAAGSIESIHIVIQLEVAVRIAASPGRRDYGYLSTLCQFFTKPEIAFKIPAGAFNPPPRVTSALVQMSLPGERATLDVADASEFLEFLQRCFAHKRKTLRNNLLESSSDAQIAAALKSCGLKPDARAEQLDLTQFAALYAAVSER
ncbi:MAG: 16S rRNA (adenine(1518)-N(6)/adenine(1519)-N(6))-dimethyltransferase RsmA [Candidatus Acidiferrales bacterium]|jgi:16S rRNA (adenine1518-N6/adenine1519-N6)-dimethyltransferase